MQRGFLMHRRAFLLTPMLAAAAPAAPMRLPIRTRSKPFAGQDDWRAFESIETIDPARAAIVICDMWDKHWCRGANERVALMVPRMAPVLDALRKRGMLVIHAPSDTMDFYKDAPQRLAMQRLPQEPPPEPLKLPDPPLPIDDSDGGCDTPGDKAHKAWTRQHSGIPVAAVDLISDKGTEIYSALRARNATHLLVMGVHTNMCILNRTFAIKQMTRWGMRCILVRDLTDAMYDPADAPRVSHARGTELVIEHIEKYWCPTTTSAEILRA